ncbi:metallophosphoesterase [Photobacterium minamisatsumaniensis]|uniref:metallophosphoesterase n=1 Tax=Photobacterium minamisatsumaniensis TaxID=2910233 RepID=UPI003D0E4528
MKKWTLSALSLLTAATLVGCNSSSSDEDDKGGLETSIQVAFMPDIHFHDIYGDFQDDSFDGLPNSQSGEGATIRTMASQMGSTRLFNENYFALLAALDDIVDRGIKYVALPGDFSDDGQPIHMRGLVKIFDTYHEKYGLEFFAAPGNHDPNRPFIQPAGKSDYLGDGGKMQPIYSLEHGNCLNASAASDGSHPVICSDEVVHWGYEDIMNILGTHGFNPQEKYHYFETPYSSDEARNNYSFDLAMEEASYENRMYEICHEGTGDEYKQDGFTSCSEVPDSSYLVEPVEGLWLLAIDANIYQPKANSVGGVANPDDYEGSGNAGYNMMLTHKAHVIDWIRDVVKAAKEQNKTLVSFSHFPMTEFYNGASEDIEDLFGEGNFQLGRKPDEETSKALAATGLSVHVGGHMHFNDTGMKSYNINGEQHTLFNIQAPSLAGYIPAYKVLNIRPDNQIEVETVIIENVPRFNELFEHYQVEHEYLTAQAGDDENAKSEIWNGDILKSETYYELTDWHIKELTRLRFLPGDWPVEMRKMIMNMDGEQMLIMSQIETDFTVCQLAEALELPLTGCAALQTSDLAQFLADWRNARIQAEGIAAENSLTLADFRSWTGEELAVDFYRLRNADELAFRDIDSAVLPQYKVLSEELAEFDGTIDSEIGDLGQYTVGDVFKSRFGSLFVILDKFATGQASDHFLIDTENQTLTDLKGTANREAMQ